MESEDSEQDLDLPMALVSRNMVGSPRTIKVQVCTKIPFGAGERGILRVTSKLIILGIRQQS